MTSDTGPVPGVERWAGRLIFDSTISPTERIVKGTRLPAEMLVAELEEGCRDEQMLEAHPELTREDLAALRAYALGSDRHPTIVRWLGGRCRRTG